MLAKTDVDVANCILQHWLARTACTFEVYVIGVLHLPVLMAAFCVKELVSSSMVLGPANVLLFDFGFPSPQVDLHFAISRPRSIVCSFKFAKADCVFANCIWLIWLAPKACIFNVVCVYFIACLHLRWSMDVLSVFM